MQRLRRSKWSRWKMAEKPFCHAALIQFSLVATSRPHWLCIIWSRLAKEYMKTILTASDTAWKKHQLNFKSAHALQIPTGHIIIGDIDADSIAALEADGATTLPYILTGENLPAGVVSALAHLGVTDADNTMTASLKVNKVHSAFHPSQF